MNGSTPTWRQVGNDLLREGILTVMVAVALAATMMMVVWNLSDGGDSGTVAPAATTPLRTGEFTVVVSGRPLRCVRWENRGWGAGVSCDWGAWRRGSLTTTTDGATVRSGG